jgi:hypothetical protein
MIERELRSLIFERGNIEEMSAKSGVPLDNLRDWVKGTSTLALPNFLKLLEAAGLSMLLYPVQKKTCPYPAGSSAKRCHSLQPQLCIIPV